MADDRYTQPDYVEKRPRYFDGQYLKVDDFIDEQQYHVDRQRRISRSLQVSGVVEGLKVEIQSGTILTIGQGAAIDSEGRQIVLFNSATVVVNEREQSISVAEDKLFKIDLTRLKQEGAQYDLIIVWHEETKEEQGEGSAENTRFYETPKIIVREHQSVGLSTEEILLESFWHENGVVDVYKPSPRQYSGLRLPADNGTTLTLRAAENRDGKKGGIFDGFLAVTKGIDIWSGGLKIAGQAIFEGSLSVGGNDNSSTLSFMIGDSGTGFKQHGVGELAIYTDNFEHLRITKDGKIGVGISQPNEALEVNGKIKLASSNGNEVILQDIGHDIDNTRKMTIGATSTSNLRIGFPKQDRDGWGSTGSMEIGTWSADRDSIFRSIIQINGLGYVGIGRDADESGGSSLAVGGSKLLVSKGLQVGDRGANLARIVAGTIASGSSGESRSGFKVESARNGVYHIRFDEPFSKTPVVTATAFTGYIAVAEGSRPSMFSEISDYGLEILILSSGSETHGILVRVFERLKNGEKRADDLRSFSFVAFEPS